MAKMTKEEFVERAIAIHGNTYCYDNSIYTKGVEPIEIYCREHGPFIIKNARRHIEEDRKQGCTDCKIKAEFIQKAKDIYGDQYCYNNISYNGCYEPIEIICKTHGKFRIKQASAHISAHRQECPQCKKIKNRQSEEKKFIEKANRIYGSKYCYKNSVYTYGDEPISIRCITHGELTIGAATNHVSSIRQGCPDCTAEMRRQDYFDRCDVKYNNIYDYTDSIFSGVKNLIDIKCRKHDVFSVAVAEHHLYNEQGCPKCKLEETESNFFEKARRLHKNKYTYVKGSYSGTQRPIKIICEKHGEFQIPFAQSHISNKRQGCTKCSEEINCSNGELAIAAFLSEHKIPYIKEFTVKEIGSKRFDFLVNDRILLEYDGAQHFREVNCWTSSLEERQKSDQIKNSWANENGYPLLRIPYWESRNIEKILVQFFKKHKLI